MLYDEPHPLGDDIGSIQTADINRKPDMLIVMGTSLKVHGFKKLVKDFAKAVHESAPSPASASTSSPKNARSLAGKVIFVNKTAPGSEWESIIDYHIVGETDKWAEKVTEDWKKMRPADWEVQKTLVAKGKDDGVGAFTVTKEITNTIAAKGKGIYIQSTSTVKSVLKLYVIRRWEEKAHDTAGECPTNRRFDHLTSTSTVPFITKQTSTRRLPLHRRRMQPLEEAGCRQPEREDCF